MPYHKVKNHSECPASKPIAVVKDSDGKVMGCHPSEDAANKQLAALYVAEEKRAGIMGPIQELWEKIKAVFEPELETERASATSGWVGSASSYGSTEAYCAACAIDVNPSGAEKKQSHCMLPYKKGGSASKAGVVAAAARFNQVKNPGVSSGIWSAAVRGAARKLISAYRSFGMDPPEVLTSAAGSRMTIQRLADGSYRWYAVCATAAINKDGEIDSRELFDSFIEEIQRTGQYPQRDFMHLGPFGERFVTGDTDTIARDGNVLVASGPYNNSELAKYEIKTRLAEPEFWGDSIHYAGAELPDVEEIEDVEVPIFRKGSLRFISTVPKEMASSLFVKSEVKEVQRMWKELSDPVRLAFIKAFGDDEEAAEAWWEANPEAINRVIAEEGVVTRTVDDGDEPDPDETDENEVVFEIDVEKEFGELFRTKMDEVLLRVQDEALNPLLERLTTLEEALQDVQTNSGKVVERLKALEQDDEDKQREWQRDLPRKRQIRVTSRARTDQAGDGDEEPISAAEQADAATQSWNTRFYKD